MKKLIRNLLFGGNVLFSLVLICLNSDNVVSIQGGFAIIVFGVGCLSWLAFSELPKGSFYTIIGLIILNFMALNAPLFSPSP